MSAKGAGRKLLVPYITGGMDQWLDAIRAAADAGADAVEIGIPFSDPVMDGPVIQEASWQSLQHGSTPQSVVAEAADLDVGIPLAVMTYYNLAYRAGHERFAANLYRAGISGCILPDLPYVESGPWRTAAEAAGVEPVLLAAPTTPEHRLPDLCAASRGFVYAVGVMGVTGVRSELAASAVEIAARCKRVTDKATLVGVGISNPEQAAEVVQVADGVVVGSSIVRRLLDGDGPEGVAALVSQYRRAIDG
ncbi:MAG: tryptophan synthase subunit alpha [Actinomycetia bacterium]|nr:tryptophan synthase subunit alpha [Actinomycetes bacterium]MCP4958930.1 tryptophan synthase subunit alpha [Actinomycetes bacterium]